MYICCTVYFLYCVFVVLCVVYIFCTVGIDVFTLDARLLARSQYPEGPVTGHLDTGFCWFPRVFNPLPYCMDRKTVFFFSGHLIYILKQERFRVFRLARGI
jgi:hypothetical protein